MVEKVLEFFNCLHGGAIASVAPQSSDAKTEASGIRARWAGCLIPAEFPFSRKGRSEFMGAVKNHVRELNIAGGGETLAMK